MLASEWALHAMQEVNKQPNVLDLYADDEEEAQDADMGAAG